MFKVIANEVLGEGTVIFYQNPVTNDIVYNIDGVDNQKLVSWHGIREGVVGFPTCINHMDLWLNSVYHRNELEGLAKFKDESDDAWDYKEREILAKFATWQRVAIFGRISADGGVLQFINTTGNMDKSKEIIEHMLNKGLVEEATHLFINNTDFDTVGKFLLVSAQCALFAREQEKLEGERPVLTSKLLIEAQMEDEKQGKQQHTDELLSVLEPWRALKAKLNDPNLSDEQKDEIKQQMKEVSAPVMNWLYDDYYPLIVREVAKYTKNYKTREDESPIDYFAPAVLTGLTKSFLNNFDPSRATISTFVGSQAGGLAKNMLNKQRSQDKQYMTVGPAFADDDGGAEAGSAGDVAGSNDPVANVTEPMFGEGPRESSPLENVLGPVIKQIEPVLAPDELDIVKKYFYDNMTLDQIGKERNVTRERIRQIIQGIIQKLQIPEIKQRLGLAKKKLFLSIK